MAEASISIFPYIHQLFPKYQNLVEFYSVLTRRKSKIIILKQKPDINENLLKNKNYPNKINLPYGVGCLNFPISLDYDPPELHDLYAQRLHDDYIDEKYDACLTEFFLNECVHDMINDGMINDKPLFSDGYITYGVIYEVLYDYHYQSDILTQILLNCSYRNVKENDISPITYIIPFESIKNKELYDQIINIDYAHIHEFEIDYFLKTDRLISIKDLEPTQYKFEYFCSSFSEKALNLWNCKCYRWTQNWWKPNGKFSIKRMEDSYIYW